MNSSRRGLARIRTSDDVPVADAGGLPREAFERPHPVTGRLVAFEYWDVSGDGVWSVVSDGSALGVVVQPYSVLEDAPTVYVALPAPVTSLAAGLYTRSWAEALMYLERNAE